MFEGLAIVVTVFVRLQLTCTNFFCTTQCPWPLRHWAAHLEGVCA